MIEQTQTDREIIDQLVHALEGFISAMEKYGDWDDGCFYYSNTAAPELECPIQEASKALSQAQQP